MGKNLTILTLSALCLFLALWDRGGRGEPEPSREAVGGGEAQSEFAALESELDELFAAPEFAAAAIGFCLIDDQGEVVVERNGAEAMIPASTLKTLTSATALEVLGPGFRFETRLLAASEIGPVGALAGDLVIRGGGDPDLSEDDLDRWVVRLKEAGLKSIAGGVVGDASYFPESIAGDFWDWSDVGNGYGSATAGLNYSHNRFAARFQGGAQVGDAVAFLGADPEVPGVEWLVRVETTAAGSSNYVSAYGGPDATRMTFRGTAAAGGGAFAISAAVPDPARFAAFALAEKLRAAGIAVGGEARGVYVEGEIAPAPVELLKHRSEMLRDIVRHLNMVSDNHEADCIYRLLGVRAGRSPDAVLRDHWHNRGLDLSACRLVDGSGLGRANFISSEVLARLQFLASDGPAAEDYRNALNFFGDEGSLQWKIGAMSSIRGYTGFFTGESGRAFTFALMFNHYRDGQAVRDWTGRVVQAMLAL